MLLKNEEKQIRELYMSFRNKTPVAKVTKLKSHNIEFKKSLEESNLNNVSANFLGNFWRFKALYDISSKEKVVTFTNEAASQIEKCLEKARDKYQED